jgi:acyl CoA:acetate/3-ketoacid CoA transferase
VDGRGNVNGHYSPGKLAGIGGFANITQNAKTVVFCTTFTAGGLTVESRYGKVTVEQEGSISKFVESVNAVSFAAENARAIGQKVLYITERCVFTLGERGLVLTEVYDGVDLQRDILDQLPFEVSLRCKSTICQKEAKQMLIVTTELIPARNLTYWAWRREEPFRHERHPGHRRGIKDSRGRGTDQVQ